MNNSFKDLNDLADYLNDEKTIAALLNDPKTPIRLAAYLEARAQLKMMGCNSTDTL
jgi:hypothetical protein